MNNWLSQQGYAIAAAWRQIRRPRGGFLLNVLVIAIALALPIFGLTLLENVRPVSEQLAVDPEISVYLAIDTPRDKANAASTAIRRVLQSAKVDGKVEFIPKEKALKALNGKTGLATAVETLGSNPLPDGYIVKLASFQNVAQAARLQEIIEELQRVPGVDHVQVDSAWVKRLAALMQVGRVALLFLAGVLGIIVVAVVFNTIRLQVLNQHEEIAVCKLVGATDGFICRPFYYAGGFLGLCAGALALAMVAAALQPLNQAVAELAKSYGTEFRLLPLDYPLAAATLACSTGLGFAGALLSVRRSLGHAD